MPSKSPEPADKRRPVHAHQLREEAADKVTPAAMPPAPTPTPSSTGATPLPALGATGLDVVGGLGSKLATAERTPRDPTAELARVKALPPGSPELRKHIKPEALQAQVPEGSGLGGDAQQAAEAASPRAITAPPATVGASTPAVDPTPAGAALAPPDPQLATPTPVAATASLTFTLSGMVWYVDNATASGTNDGRSNTPFKTMTAVNTASTSNGDFIYVAKGTGSTTGAYAMKTSQQLIGAGATLDVPTVSPLLTVAGNAANTPTLSGTLTLASSVVVNGIDMSTGSSTAVTGTNVTGINMPLETAEALSSHPNIVGMKDSNGDVGQVAGIVARVPGDFAVLVGSAATLYPSLLVGAAGAVVAVANVVPELCVKLFELARAGRHEEAQQLQRRLTPLALAVTREHGIAGLKIAMEIAGYVGGEVRRPLRPAKPEARETLQRLLEELTR